MEQSIFEIVEFLDNKISDKKTHEKNVRFKFCNIYWNLNKRRILYTFITKIKRLISCDIYIIFIVLILTPI